MTKFQTKYKHERPLSITFTKPSLTEQQFAFDADINNIVKGFTQPQAVVNTPIFGQKFDLDMYQNAINIVADAKSEFYKLPSNIRREFDDDPAKLVKFMDSTDEADIKKGVKLGLYTKDALKIFEKEIVSPTNPPVENKIENKVKTASE